MNTYYNLIVTRSGVEHTFGPHNMGEADLDEVRKDAMSSKPLLGPDPDLVEIWRDGEMVERLDWTGDVGDPSP